MTEQDRIRRKLAGRTVVASISGGKDSAAMALYLRELEVPAQLVFIDTGWEHPKTYDYLRGDWWWDEGSILLVSANERVACRNCKCILAARRRSK